MRAAKIDRNQPEIVAALRDYGATVQILSAVGKGCPDLLVGWRGENHLLEVKMPDGTMTKDQKVWHTLWQGKALIVRSAKEAIDAINGDTNDAK